LLGTGGLLANVGLATTAGLLAKGGLLGVAATGRAGGITGLAGAAGAAGFMAAGADVGLVAAGAGALAWGASPAPAFFTERMALGGAAGVAGAAAGLPLLPVSIKERMRDASSSLIELLWLLAATPSFSAASSTSLFSRPRSRDSS
jgi:hypothetical protein